MDSIKVYPIIMVTMLLLMTHTVAAQIYRCEDTLGNVIYTDQGCQKDNTETKVIPQTTNTVTPTVPTDEEGKPLKVIYNGSPYGTNSRFLKVAIYEESDHHMTFYIEGFNGERGNSRLDFRVMPNIRWSSNLFTTSERGKVSGYARVSLGSKEEDTATSDIIRLVIWKYENGKSVGPIESRIVPYKKSWVKKP